MKSLRLSRPSAENDIGASASPGMIYIAAGSFEIGSERFYPEEAPVRRVHIDGFWIDETPVTNAEFADFVAATGHVTLAEKAPDPSDYPEMVAEDARPGSLVFEKTAGPVYLHDITAWWHFRFGANWRRPLGYDSSLAGLADHPVVHV